MKQIIIALMLMYATTLSGQVQWQENGIPVRQGVNIEWSRAATSLDDGSIVLVWSDTRRGDRDVWAQKIDIDGELLWGEEGVLVNGEINRQEDPVVINTGDDGVVIAWVDFRNEDAGDVYSQKLDSDGNLLWDEIGVPLCLAEDVQISLNIANDANNGAYIIWLDSRNPGGVDIYGNHILPDGNLALGWNLNGNSIAAENGGQDGHTFWEDGAGGAILAWHDSRNTNNENLYMQRISSDGTLLWGAGGMLLCDAVGIQESVKITPDGTGSFILTWRDKRYENDGDIFAQRVDINGSLLWIEDVEVSVVTNSIQRNPRITNSSDDGAIIVWEDGRNDPYIVDLYAQKVDLNGTLVWASTSVPICTEPDDQLAPRLANDNSGGCYFVWVDGRVGGHPHEDIYMQHLDTNGNFLWEENGKLICDETGEQASPLLRRDGSGNVYAIWGDKFGDVESSKIYVQILDGAGNIFLNSNGKIVYSGLCGNAENHKILDNGNNSIIIWGDSRDPLTGKRIFMQVLNSSGTINLEENGKAITEDTGFDQENHDIVLSPNLDTIAIVWEENRFGSKQTYAQAVDMNCNYLWSNSGIIVGDILCEQQGPKISVESVPTRSENYYIGWSDFRNWMNPGIFGQKINDGELQWAEEGIEIVNISGDDRLTDLVERFFIWQNEQWPDNNIYVKLIDEDGNTAPGWSDDGLEICGAPGNQSNAKGLMTPQGLLVVWEDMRDTLSLKNIYGQIVTYDGEILWEQDGVPLVALDNDQLNPVFVCEDDIYLAWEDFRDGEDYDIYMQKYDDNGSELWTTGGVDVVTKINDQSAPSLVGFGDSIFVCWEDYRDTTSAGIYGQKLNSEGELQWNTDDLLICNAIKNQSDPLAVKNGSNYSVVIWKDTRSSGKADIYGLYAQKIEIIETTGNYQEFSLVEEWNWISFNLHPDDTSLYSVFDPLMPDDIFQVKNQTQSATNWGGIWIGDLTNIADGEGYLVNMNNAFDPFIVSGEPIESTTPIYLNENWNWIGYYPQYPLTVEYALVSISETAGQIKNQT